MANDIEIVAWLFKNAETLDLKIDRLTWPKKYDLNFTDYSISIKVGGHLVKSRGTDLDPNRALLKSLSEAIERSVVKIGTLGSTNGMAAHTSKSNAQLHAKLELVERDLFLCHFHSRTPFLKLDKTIIDDLISVKFAELLSFLNRNSIEMDFYSMGQASTATPPNNGLPNSILVRFSGLKCTNRFGFLFGLGTNFDLALAVTSALIEGLRFLDFYWTNQKQIEILDLAQFAKIENVTFIDHGKLALSPDYTKLIKFLFEPEMGISTTNWLELSSIEVTEIELDDILELRGCPIHVMRAHAKIAHNLYCGTYSNETSNLERLRLFTGNNDLNHGDLLCLPHPIQ